MIGRTNAVIGKSGSKWPSADEVQVTYTGEMEAPREITDAAGNKYDLYVLKSAGTFSVNKDIIADVCIVTAGGNGASFSSVTNPFRRSLAGGKGGKMIQVTTVLSGNMRCVIGAPHDGDSSMTINDIVYDRNSYGSSENVQGTGGGQGEEVDSALNVTGDGRTKYVFGDTSVYDYPICAGGGGGLYYDDTNRTYSSIIRGGVGGTNGGDGGMKNAAMVNPDAESTSFPEMPEVPIVEGGYYGGGASFGVGKANTPILPTAGMTYGSGGGGGCTYWSASMSGNSDKHVERANGASGMQGAIFIRLLKY